jgi:ribonuclease HI
MSNLLKKDLKIIMQLILETPKRCMFMSDQWVYPDLTIYCDASKIHETDRAGIGIWIPHLKKKYFLTGICKTGNNPLELWCIVVALHICMIINDMMISKLNSAKIRIYTDNSASVHSLGKRMGVHNDSLKYLSLMQHKFQFSLQTCWISRDHNSIADQLAKGNDPTGEVLQLPQFMLDLVDFKVNFTALNLV